MGVKHHRSAPWATREKTRYIKIFGTYHEKNEKYRCGGWFN